MKSSSIFVVKPSLLSIGRLPEADHMMASHSYDYLALYVVVQGNIDMDINDAINFLEPGNIAIVEKGVRHTILTPISEDHIVFKIGISDLHILGNQRGTLLNENDIPSLDIQNDKDYVFFVCKQIVDEYERSGKNKSEEICSYLLNILLIIILRNKREAKEISFSDITEKIKKYIEENLHEEITLTKLATDVYVSTFHMAHIFKKEMGISPIQYLITCRIEKAKELLSTTSKTILDIAQIVGYPNANYFNLLFKRSVGMSPGRYRKKAGSQNNKILTEQ